MRIENPFQAGFIAGEGHFSISPNNAGQSWAFYRLFPGGWRAVLASLQSEFT